MERYWWVVIIVILAASIAAGIVLAIYVSDRPISDPRNLGTTCIIAGWSLAISLVDYKTSCEAIWGDYFGSETAAWSLLQARRINARLSSILKALSIGAATFGGLWALHHERTVEYEISRIQGMYREARSSSIMFDRICVSSIESTFSIMADNSDHERFTASEVSYNSVYLIPKPREVKDGDCGALPGDVQLCAYGSEWIIKGRLLENGDIAANAHLSQRFGLPQCIREVSLQPLDTKLMWDTFLQSLNRAKSAVCSIAPNNRDGADEICNYDIGLTQNNHFDKI
jgi:hypothetical protein